MRFAKLCVLEWTAKTTFINGFKRCEESTLAKAGKSVLIGVDKVRITGVHGDDLFGGWSALGAPVGS